MKLEGVETEIIFLFRANSISGDLYKLQNKTINVWTHNGISIHDANDTRVNPL